MDTKKYEVFAKTVELSSLTAAAQALGLTQSAVSHIIAAIEEELQLTLLKRSRTGARLTPEGERLLPYIKELLHQETLLRKAAEGLRGLAAGTVRIGTFTSVATHWLPGMMKEFQQLHPQVEFGLFNGDYHDVSQWLRQGSVDLAFTALPMEQDCECIVLGEDRLMAILPEGHPLAKQEICSVEAVAREPFISLLETSDHDARRALDKAGVRPNVKFSTKDDYAILAMVRQGLGVSIMPELLLRGQSSGIAVRPLDPPSSRMLALALPAGERTGPAARRFAEFAAEWVSKNT